MNNKINNLSRKIARFSYLLGIASMLVAMLLSIAPQPARADTSPCGSGFEVKLEGTGPFSYTTSSDKVISEVGIKSGTGCFYFTEDGSDGCYQVFGIGTQTVNVQRIGSGSSCQAISHIIIYTTDKLKPTEPTDTPTPDPSETPTDTPTPDPSETPTDTPTPDPSETPTDTPTPDPSETPTDTPTPDPSETPTDTPTPDPSETPTDTPTPDPSETPTDTPTPDPSDTPTEQPPAVTTPEESPEPTLPPPPQIVQNDQPALLIPVTGADLSLGAATASQLQSLFGSLGLAFFGLGLVFTGLAKRKDQ